MRRALPLLLLAAPASAQLSLSPVGSIDITPIVILGIGGLDYDEEFDRLWLADGDFTNHVFELDPVTGSVLFEFDAAVIPGFAGGSDSIALDPTTGYLYLSSAFLGGPLDGVVTRTGQLVSTWSNTALRASGATINDAGELWVFSTEPNELRRVDPQSGAVLTSFPLATGDLHALAADPQSGHLFGLEQTSCLLYEFDPATGAVLSLSDLSLFPFLSGCVPAAMTFGPGGRTVYIGEGSLTNATTIWIFERFGPTGTTYCSPAELNSTGLPGTLLALGSDAAGGNWLELRMQNLPPYLFGYFLCSQVQGFTPFAGGSQGHLCLAAPIGRFVQQIGGAGPGGVIAISVDTLALPLTPLVAAQAGESWSFQGWYRDANPGNTSNFTNGVEVVFQ